MQTSAEHEDSTQKVRKIHYVVFSIFQLLIYFPFSLYMSHLVFVMQGEDDFERIHGQ